MHFKGLKRGINPSENSNTNALSELPHVTFTGAHNHRCSQPHTIPIGRIKAAVVWIGLTSKASLMHAVVVCSQARCMPKLWSCMSIYLQGRGPWLGVVHNPVKGILVHSSWHKARQSILTPQQHPGRCSPLPHLISHQP